MAGTAGRKSVLITGCSDGGLGAAMAREFAARGFHVFATVRSTAKAASLAADPADGKTGSEWIELLELDVASTTAIRACAETVAARTGGTLDVLVNNAGCSLWMPLLDADLEASRRVFDVNVWGMLAVAQAFGPMLVRAKGAMLNICSIAGAVRMAWQGIYNTSKAAETWLSETLRIELEPLGVRVVTAMVGEVDTNVYANGNAGKPLKLPPTSYYRSIEDIIAKQSQGLLADANESPAVTARNLVRDVLGTTSGQVWRGGNAGKAKVASWLFPTVLERLLHSSRGVYQLRPPTFGPMDSKTA